MAWCSFSDLIISAAARVNSDLCGIFLSQLWRHSLIRQERKDPFTIGCRSSSFSFYPKTADARCFMNDKLQDLVLYFDRNYTYTSMR